MPLRFDNGYARLPERFYARQQPQTMPALRLVLFNEALGRELGFDAAADAQQQLASLLSGRMEGAEPLAMVYAGHQFGNWVPRLGDGRALLLGEVVTAAGEHLDIHLKGSGRTPFSRGGDGRAVLGPVLREFIVSEAMARLGIPTTRALAALTTGDEVMREEPLPGALMVRVARSHVRVGTFQYFMAMGDHDGLRQLADFVIDRLYPQARTAPQPYRAFLDAVIEAQARLVAEWMGVGFIHGVMNTDNTSIAGETIDYGPCAFMDTFDPATVFSSIDVYGRYAYGNQPDILYWNLARLAQALMPLLAEDPAEARAFSSEAGTASLEEKRKISSREAQTAVDRFPALYEAAWLAVMRRKLGLLSEQAGDMAMIMDFYRIMREMQADHTLGFRALASSLEEATDALAEPAFAPWLERWRARLKQDWTDNSAPAKHLNSVNPLYIPRNHLVEEALAAAYAGDYGPAKTLHGVLAEPFTEQKGRERYAQPPRPEQVVQQTFCGT